MTRKLPQIRDQVEDQGQKWELEDQGQELVGQSQKVKVQGQLTKCTIMKIKNPQDKDQVLEVEGQGQHHKGEDQGQETMERKFIQLENQGLTEVEVEGQSHEVEVQIIQKAIIIKRILLQLKD